MNYRTVLILVVAGFCVFCGVLVVQSGLFDSCSEDGRSCVLLQRTTGEEAGEAKGPSAPESAMLEAAQADFTAVGGPADTVILGATDPCMEDPEAGFKFQLELSSRGAAIAKATFSDGDGKGFDDRNPKGPKPLVILSPVGGEVLSMANREFVLVHKGRQLRLDRLSWKSSGVERGYDDSEAAQFEAIINDPNNEPVVKLTKRYKVVRGSYLLECDITVENQSASEQKVRFSLAGPVGIGREAFRGDMRKVVAAFKGPDDKIGVVALDIGKFDGKNTFDQRPLSGPGGEFLWAAVTNKYFTGILVPVPEEQKAFCDWIRDRAGFFYNPDGRKNSDDEDIGVNVKTTPTVLSRSGAVNSTKKYSFQLYLGPKDKSLFDKNDYYRKLGFARTIDFPGCCCPSAMIRPLAFGILGLMKWMYGFIHNYGVVIIILVFLFRIVIHPLTKKSQVSMSGMSKLAPRVEEIKKKYANNKAELNKQMMALYREQGASPVVGMLPMFVQMPIWIALWSAVYTSIELRGAAFLPFWITDLSAPDALFRFQAVTLPLFGKLDSFNLLPILMGVAFYLQQKLMPSQGAANPQAAQQQKMMMIMMPIMFPLLMYKAPSGVNLYIMASTFAGVIEQYIVRKHIREKEQAESQGLVAVTSKTGGKVKKKKPKPFYRIR
ncbi:MAG: YidC/Oxa1 family insertase periplasmic-domain containing protein [Planctomycetota bacterium]|jgi:YidC/Oxa1 family membrane protein insertase